MRIFRIIFLLFLFVVCCHAFYVVFLKTDSAPASLALLRGNYDKLQETYPLYLTALEAKRFIPAGSKIEISPFGINIYRLAMKYIFFPGQMDIHWDFFIDFDRLIHNPSPAWKAYELSTGVLLYVKPGHDILSVPREIKPYPPGKMLILFLGVTTLNLGAGALLLYLLSLKNAGHLMVLFMGTGYMVAFLIVTIIIWLYLLLGGGLEQNTLIILWVMASFAILIIGQSDSTDKQAQK